MADPIKRFPRILYFIAGMFPTAEQRDEIAKLGPKAAFRNANMVSPIPTSSLEECDAVAGPDIPERYAKTYPNVADLTSGTVNRPSDLDLPHATLTGDGVTAAGNEAARAARPPSVNDFVSPTAPRPAGSMTAPHGGTSIAPPAGNTLSSFGAERGENAAKPGEGGASGVMPGADDGTANGDPAALAKAAAEATGKGTDGSPVGSNLMEGFTTPADAAGGSKVKPGRANPTPPAA